jgi:hypothetical protein
VCAGAIANKAIQAVNEINIYSTGGSFNNKPAGRQVFSGLISYLFVATKGAH